MALQNFTWNNGTQSSPIVLSFEQIAALSAAGKNPDITTDIGGFITTNSHKIQKFLKLSLEEQFPKLTVVVDEELADTFGVNVSNPNINEGSSIPINITGDSGITHDYLLWNLNYKSVTIDGDISEAIIKSRIHITNGQIVVDDPQENASWQVVLEITAYPSYYEGTNLSSIPESSRPSFTVAINAKAITAITATTKEEIPINSSVEIKVTPTPSDSTKLKGATYTYTTSTPNTVFCAGDYIRTQGNSGAGVVTVNLNTCGGKVKLNTTVNFTVYDLRPMTFIIDQRYLSNLSDPVGMVSENCILNADGSLTSISNTGKDGNPNNNTLTWIRQNTHAFVSRYMGFSGLRLKQLSDTTRKKFADGTSSVDYISNESGEFDVFLKFGSDIFYKTEAFTPQGQANPNVDYVAVTIAKELSEGESEANWVKWSQYKLIGVYPACQIGNKLYSLSGKRSVNNISQTNSIARAKARGTNFNICDYDMTKLFAFLFYGYYSSLGCQQICGYGTSNLVNNVYYPKITGGTDELAMTDTDTTTGNGAATPDSDQIKAGTGSDIKSVNFWGLEKCWGDLSEWISNLRVMEAARPESNNTPNVSDYIADYLDEYISITITKQDGTDVTYTSKADFLAAYDNPASRFLAITDKNNVIVRAIDVGKTANSEGYIKKMIFGKHADIIAKEYNNGAGADTGFCDYGRVSSAGRVALRSDYSASPAGGVGCLHAWAAAGYTNSYVGARLLYDGDENTVYIINDATETL